MVETLYLYDEKAETQFSVEVITPDEIYDPKPKTPDGELPWLGFINYRRFMELVARVGKEKKMLRFPLGSHRSVPDQRTRLFQEARRMGFPIKTYRWGDDILVWRADYPVEFIRPCDVQDFYSRLQRRKLSGLTQAEAARRIGINGSALSKFEAGYGAYVSTEAEEVR